MRDKTREQILKEVEERIKTMVKEMLEALMREEREIYLESHPTKANGYYTRDLLTLVGPLEELKVPRVREGDFHLKILPYRKRASLELSEAILAPYAVGVSTRKISAFLEGIYGALYSPQSISHLPEVTQESETLAGKAPKRGVLRGVFGWDLSLHPSRENGQGTRVHCSRDQARWKKGDPRILAVRCRRGERPELGRSPQGPQATWGPKGANLRTFDLPGLEEAIKKIFPDADRQLCVLHAVWDALNRVRKKDREALAEDLKKIYRAETREEAEEALRKLRGRWGGVYPKIVERWESKAYALLAFLQHPKPIRQYLYTTNQLERLAKEVKRRTKVVEVFCGEGAVEKLLYLVLSQLDERWGGRKLRGFAEIEMGSYHAGQTH